MTTALFKVIRKLLCVRWLMVPMCLALLSACSYHPTSPVEDDSGRIVKRQLNSDGSYYVRSGDTLYAIAFSYGVDPMDVAARNGIASPYVIYPGQKLRLVDPSGNRTGGGQSGVKVTGIKSPGRATTKSVSTPGNSSSTKSAPAKPEASKPAETKASPPPSAVSSSTGSSKTTSKTKAPATTTAGPTRWIWPTKGRVVHGYVAGNPARNGLDIAGREGQAITASSGGQVAYSGNGLIGYGELIIIKHSEKMLSAYAHNKVRLVKEGEQVTSGQKIAEMGRNSSNDQLLHFEIRAFGKPVNPLDYLPKK